MRTPKKPIVLWGASGHALVVADILRLKGQHEIRGFLDSENANRRGERFCGSTVLGGKEVLSGLLDDGVTQLMVAFGACDARLRAAEYASGMGFNLVTAVHPCAVVAKDATIGQGSVVMAGAVINPGCRIGQNVIVNTSASIDHETVLEDGVHVSPGAHVAGGVRIGRATWIGIGATVIEQIRIGSNAIIGAGAVVTRDIPDRVVAMGVPARVVRGC